MRTRADIALRRLRQQRLLDNPLNEPREVVAWMGAVQAQDYAAAKWAIGLRLKATSDDAVEQAFNRGEIVRTHMLRPTWHFVSPADIHWLLALSAPRVHAANASRYRELDLDRATLRRSQTVMTKALEGGQELTRDEMRNVLERAGIATTGQRMSHILMAAELDAVMCSAARRGKQFTYALLAERVPPTAPLPRDEALSRLTARYFISHGPATVQDCAWWSGLTMSDVRRGIALAGAQLRREEIDERVYWIAAVTSLARVQAPRAYLLPAYDEYTVAYRDRSSILSDPALEPQALGPVVVLNGAVIGSWKRTVQADRVVITLNLLTPPTPAAERAIVTAARRYGAFLQLQPVIELAQ